MNATTNLHHLRIAAEVIGDLDAAPSVASMLRRVARVRRVALIDLARHVGLPYGRIEAALNGRRSARPDDLAAIAAALGVDLEP